MVRGALASLLGLEPDIEVVAQVVARRRGRGRAPRRRRPDVALLDIEMPGATGLEAAAELRRELPELSRPDRHDVRPSRLPAPRDGGRRGRVPAEGRARRRSWRARSVAPHAGERVVDPGSGRGGAQRGREPADPARARGPRGVAHATRRSPTSRARCTSRPGTVRNHLSSVMRKLDARNRGRGGAGGGGEGVVVGLAESSLLSVLPGHYTYDATRACWNWVDRHGSGPCARKSVEVRVLSPALRYGPGAACEARLTGPDLPSSSASLRAGRTYCLGPMKVSRNATSAFLDTYTTRSPDRVQRRLR